MIFWLVLPASAGGDVDPERAAALYQEAFDLLDVELGEQEQDVLYGEREEGVRDETRERIREGLEALSRAASAKTVAWPVEEKADELFALSSFEHLGPARDAVRKAAWYARDVGEGDPDAALDVLKSALAVSRHVNDDGMLIQLLTSIAIEGIAYSAVEDLAGSWEQHHRDRLLEIIRNQVPERSVRAAVAREGEYMLSKMNAALFSIPETASLSELVRISSIAALPEERWLVLEHLGLNKSFRLRPGETRHGIELVAFNPEEDHAVIRSEGEEAMIHLQSRQIEMLNTTGFFQLFGLEADGEVARRLVEETDRGMPGLIESLTGEESDAEVALLWLHEMETAYQVMDALLAQPFGRLPTDVDREAELPFPEGTGPFARQLAQTFVRVRLSDQAMSTYRDMVVTGLRLLDDAEAPVPQDPFSQGGEMPLEISMDADAIEVRSRHDMGRDRSHSFRLER